MRRFLAILPLLAMLPGCLDIPQASAPQRSVRQSTAVFTPRPEARQCLASLGATRANFTPLPDQYFGAGCSQVNTVRLAALQGDNASLALSNLGPVTCPLAETFAAWARYGIDRAARQELGSRLVRIETMGSYNCRSISGSDRLSAHAKAGASPSWVTGPRARLRSGVSSNWCIPAPANALARCWGQPMTQPTTITCMSCYRGATTAAETVSFEPCRSGVYPRRRCNPLRRRPPSPIPGPVYVAGLRRSCCRARSLR